MLELLRLQAMLASRERVDDLYAIVIRAVLHVFAVSACDTGFLAGCKE